MRFSCVLIIVAMVSIWAVALGQLVEQPIQVGEEARDFALSTIDGNTFQLSDFKGKNVVVLGIGDPYG